MIVPVLLAGGVGKRLWPLSNERTPKQFLSVVTNNLSFYQASIERIIQCVSARTFITVTTSTLAANAKHQFQRFESKHSNHILQEPFSRNTAAAIALAALYAQALDEDALLWIAPSDHSIQHVDRLKEAVTHAIPYARDGYIATLGITPHNANSHYGYILADAPSAEPALTVTRFIEKPSRETIASFADNIPCFWNSGMFICSARTLLNEIQCYGNTLLQSVRAAYHSARHSTRELRILPQAYTSIQDISIDTLVMEHSKKLKVIPADIGWRDVGSWQSLWEFTKESRYTTVPSPPLWDEHRECGNCLAYLNKRFTHSI